MKKLTIIENIIYFIGLFLFLSGLGRSLDFISFIPNKSVALIYICIGIAFILTSYFLKTRTDQ